MKLGLSQATYRWVCYPWLRYDVPEFRYSERRLPYFISVDPPETSGAPVDWLVDRVIEHDLTSLYMEAGWLSDPVVAVAFAERTRAGELAFIGSSSANLAATEDEWGDTTYPLPAAARQRVVYRATPGDHGWAGGSPFEVLVRAMELAAAAGGRIINVVHDVPARHNHFSKEPPIDRQIERMIRNFRTLVPVAERLGIVMATESHMDYRCADLLAVMEAVDSPWLRHCFDFANPITVIEDPLDAVRLVAPYTVVTHIKDMHARPMTQLGEPRFFHAPIGSGDVPIEAILEILQAEAPDPDRLEHCLEIVPTSEYDPEAWLQASLDWLRTNCARFWN